LYSLLWLLFIYWMKKFQTKNINLETKIKNKTNKIIIIIIIIIIIKVNKHVKIKQ